MKLILKIWSLRVFIFSGLVSNIFSWINLVTRDYREHHDDSVPFFNSSLLSWHSTHKTDGIIWGLSEFRQRRPEFAFIPRNWITSHWKFNNFFWEKPESCWQIFGVWKTVCRVWEDVEDIGSWCVYPSIIMVWALIAAMTLLPFHLEKKNVWILRNSQLLHSLNYLVCEKQSACIKKLLL